MASYLFAKAVVTLSPKRHLDQYRTLIILRKGLKGGRQLPVRSNPSPNNVAIASTTSVARNTPFSSWCATPQRTGFADSDWVLLSLLLC